MSKGTKILVIILALIILCAGGYLIYDKYFTPHKTIYVWQSDIAREQEKYGIYYGLSVFLKKHYSHANIIYTNSIDSLPQDSQSIVFTSKGGDFINRFLFNDEDKEKVKQDTDTLLNWVKKGNHIVVNQSERYLLDKLNVKAYFNKEYNKEAIQKRLAKVPEDITKQCQNSLEQIQKIRPKSSYTEKFNQEDILDYMQHCSLELAKLRLPENQQILYLLPYSSVFDISHIKYPVMMKADNAYGTVLVRVKYGKGSITLIPNGNIFSNPKPPTRFEIDLNRFDNAYLASYLAQGKSNILISKDTLRSSRGFLPSWLRFLVKFKLFTLLIILLLMSVLWHKASFMGGTKKLDDYTQRDFRRYLYAYGFLIVKYGGYREALIKLQKDLFKQWEKILDPYPNMDKKQQLAILHKYTQISRQDLSRWLEPLPSSISTHEWITYLKAHQRIRRKQHDNQ